MGFHDENPDVVTMYLWYRWGERASHNALNQYWVGGQGRWAEIVPQCRGELNIHAPQHAALRGRLAQTPVARLASIELQEQPALHSDPRGGAHPAGVYHSGRYPPSSLSFFSPVFVLCALTGSEPSMPPGCSRPAERATAHAAPRCLPRSHNPLPGAASQPGADGCEGERAYP